MYRKLYALSHINFILIQFKVQLKAMAAAHWVIGGNVTEHGEDSRLNELNISKFLCLVAGERGSFGLKAASSKCRFTEHCILSAPPSPLQQSKQNQLFVGIKFSRCQQFMLFLHQNTTEHSCATAHTKYVHAPQAHQLQKDREKEKDAFSQYKLQV